MSQRSGAHRCFYISGECLLRVFPGPAQTFAYKLYYAIYRLASIKARLCCEKKQKSISFSAFIVYICGSGSLQTSIHSIAFEYLNNSSKLSSIALFPLPTAGKTVVKRLRLSSRYTSMPSFMPNGQTPPTGCPTS